MTTATEAAMPCAAHLVGSSTTRLRYSTLAPLLYWNAAFWTKKKLSSRNSSSTIAALPFELSPPPIDHDFLDSVAAEGAKVSEEGIIETFDNDDEAFDAFDNGVVVMDLSHFGRIRVEMIGFSFFITKPLPILNVLVKGSTKLWSRLLCRGCGYCERYDVDRMDVIQFLLRRQRGRLILLMHGLRKSRSLTVSPGTCGNITEMLNKYIFFADKVEIQDITKQTCLFALAGPKCSQVTANLNLGDLVGQPYGTNRHYSVNGMPTVGVGNIISEDGFSLLMSPAAAGPVWKTLLSNGAIPLGRPAPRKELTDDFNVLEAGLWNSISLNKGCYKGQETISRLITYDGVKQRLWGIHLSAPAEPGSPITVDGKKVGKLTSYTSGRKECDHFALGYIKRKAASDGDTVIVGENIIGTVVNVPFLSRQSPPVKNSSP
ncbi:Detected protein of confused Function [Hibiscus syriacus]|uniref:Detected protein of confused Function n=1 Tax=Hibiscus syriacus TaxID=106335 RepID=A0A6A2X4Y0_HIBSY|nr:Detected protein of confused Function [Hibiscus syriacus]